MLSFTHKTVDGTLVKTSNLEIQQTVPSHLVILSDYLSRGMMGSAVWGWFGPWRWGWRAGLILLYLLQHHNTHTASPLRPHREQTFTRHTITHSLTHTLCHSRTWIQSVPSHICAQFSGTKVSSKSRTHSVFLVNKRCTSSQKKTHSEIRLCPLSVSVALRHVSLSSSSSSLVSTLTLCERQ